MELSEGVSFEVVYDLDSLFSVLDRLLAPGGRQVHVIDLRDWPVQ
jgi:hypothetical protein